MLTLAIDTTANTATAALLRDGSMAALYTVNGLLTHSETMLPMIENMLEKSALTVSDIDLFAVSEGPGSFTGVRIGVSLIKGLSYGSDKPCVGVSTLDALAKNLEGFDGFVVPVMDARRNQVYTAIFRDGERLSEDMLIPLDELYTKLTELGAKSVRLVGDGYNVASKYFADKDIVIMPTPATLIPQNAMSVAIIAEQMYKNGEFKTDRELAARYLRASQAEREREEKLKSER